MLIVQKTIYGTLKIKVVKKIEIKQCRQRCRRRRRHNTQQCGLIWENYRQMSQ